MATIDSLETLLVDELRDMYDAEQRLTKAIPKLVESSTNRELVQALNSHLAETHQHVARLEQVFSDLGEEAETKTCAGMKGLLKEGDDRAGDDYEDPGLRDAAIIGSAQRVEHYEIAAYGTAIAHAKLLGRDEVVRLLEATLAEEKAADRTLTSVAERAVNLDAAMRADGDVGRTTRTTM
jgi:ferritin-like metal-binding protein YciE